MAYRLTWYVIGLLAIYLVTNLILLVGNWYLGLKGA